MKKIFLTVVTLVTIAICGNLTRAAQTDITGPAGSSQFGSSVAVLPNGNIVVTDPNYGIPSGAANVGAVYLYNGATLALISTLTGSTPNDRVGSFGIYVLTNGNYVIVSQNWGGTRGAVTWCSQTTGCSGTVSSSNSLVGSTTSDVIGNGGVTVLTNGNYVVRSTNWDNGAINGAGAVTFGNGTTGTSGTVSASNSLVGSTAGDFVGNAGVYPLTNGNYVVASSLWDNGAINAAGAVTFGNGTTGRSGTISASNSLVGSQATDNIGNNGVTALTNGNYVVTSLFWNNGAINDAGAVTFGNGVSGISGTVSSSNSLVGSAATDIVGNGNVYPLTNGNYVVNSPNWNNGAITDAGAVTFGSGVSGISGTISASNSLVGSTATDAVGNGGITALTNGNYVVASSLWDNGAILNVGAATFGSGVSGISGTISSSNSLVGSTATDAVGSGGITALTNGNYVVASSLWDNGAILNVGAATFGSGISGISGTISSSNSLVGSTAGDQVGTGATALTNGNYVVRSSNWDNGAIVNAGAATFGSGVSGISGTISSSNSLVGSTAGDQVGGSVTALTNGNYVVSSSLWDNGAILNVGAVTFGNGTTGTSGAVSSSNSLVGSQANDLVGNSSVTALTNGNYVVNSLNLDNGAITDAGAATFGNGTTGISGTISASNSLVGSTAADNVGTGATALTNGNYFITHSNWDNGAIVNAEAATFGNGISGASGAITNGTSGGNSVVGTVENGVTNATFDATRNRLVVGRAASNTVSILSFTTTAIADGDISNAANWSNGLPNPLVTGIIPSGRAMTISSVFNAGQIQVQCGGNLTGGSSAAYIVGSVRKDFCSAANESFTFPIGDPNNYSPLAVSNTNGTGSLTASVTDNFLPELPAALSLSRYWSLTGAGITTNLTFSYTNADVNGTETNYTAAKRNGNPVRTAPVPSTVNAAANTFTVPNVSQFSDWSAGETSLAPTAAAISISGRVLTADGAGVKNASVSVMKPNGESVTVTSTTFGYYKFDELEAGETYILIVNSKRYAFAPRVVSANDELTEVDLIAQPE